MKGVRQLRERRMLSQQELAERAGVSLFTIQRIERGEGSVRPKTGRAVAAALGVSVEELGPKAQAPLPLEFQEEGTVQRGAALLEAWKNYIRERTRSWKEINLAEMVRAHKMTRNDIVYMLGITELMRSETTALLATARREIWAAIETEFPPEAAREQLDELMVEVQTIDHLVRDVYQALEESTTEFATEDSRPSPAIGEDTGREIRAPRRRPPVPLPDLGEVPGEQIEELARVREDLGHVARESSNVVELLKRRTA